jgi:thiol-disulfide isomerase/thioredoxin
MRNCLAALTLLGLLAAAGTADEAKPGEKKDASKPALKLKAGDPAPELKATKWLQGDEVKGFEKGKVYVVEVWATWCGPCIVMMPHLAEMQKEYKSKGVTFIGFSTKTQDAEDKIAAFVKKRGPKLGYTFAYGDDSDAWMKASGQGGIPCSFVVDKSSKVAFIGHPLYLDVVLPKVVDGTWDAEAGAKEIQAIDKELDAVFGTLNKEPKTALKALADFEARHQAMKDIPYFVGPKLSALLKSGRTAEAKEFAASVLKKAEKFDDAPAMRAVSAGLRTEAKGDKELLALALKAAEGMVAAAGDKDALALVNLASTHFAAGDVAKAKEVGKKAVEAASGASAGLKKYVEQEVKNFDAEPKGEKK